MSSSLVQEGIGVPAERTQWAAWGALFTAVVALDQVTKVYAERLLQLADPVPVIPGFFNLTLVHNRGAAFGMFSSLADPWRWVVLWGFSLFAVCLVIRFLLVDAKGDRLMQLALVGVLAGAAGNKICRLRQDYVIDFFDFYIGSYHWPAFNIADSAICIGVALLVLRSFLSRGRGRENQESSNNSPR